MGYYINPLITVLLGVTFLKEKLNIYHSAALILAATGVAIIIIRYGKIPWISLTLAISFALYGLLKKLINVDASVGMALETAILSPFALIYVGFKQLNGTGSLGHISFGVMALLLLAGVATATPLLLFAKGAQRINLSVVGFLQYISPTISLLLGVLVFHEIFSQAAFLSFSFIWASLIVFSLQGIFLKQMKTV
jgi:chloramphenicol-sensitive protein RarD